MTQFFVEGGFSMWIILFGGLATAAAATVLGRERRSRILQAGAFFVLLASVFGLSMGMSAVSAHAPNFPDPAAAAIIGLGELAHNGTFGAAVALALWIASLVTHRAQTAS